MLVARSRESTSIPPESCGEVSGEIGASGGSFCLARAPHDVIKAPDPCTASGMISASPDPGNESTGAPDPLGVLLPRLRDTWSPLARQEATGALTTAPTRADGTDVTVHSQQECRNHALTQHDPGHSTTTTSIHLQRRGKRQLYHLTPSLRKSGRLYRPSSMAQTRTERSMATTCYTSRWRGQKINVHCISALQGNCSHRIRRKTAAPETTFFVFLFHLFPILSFFHECNPSPLLGNYKRGGRGHTL
jgi:hypothetical protein